MGVLPTGTGPAGFLQAPEVIVLLTGDVTSFVPVQELVGRLVSIRGPLLRTRNKNPRNPMKIPDSVSAAGNPHTHPGPNIAGHMSLRSYVNR
jgi:hypothetical protein